LNKIVLYGFLLVTVSLFACSSPQSYSLKPPRHGGVYVVAHRGAHIGVPENSIPAYQKAIDLGVDFVEVDVRTTKDGKLVSVHNSNIDSYTNGVSGKVGDYILAELQAIDIGARVGPQWKGTHIPTLEEIFSLCKGRCGIYLDLKEAPVPELVRLIRKYDMAGDVLWYSPAIRFRMFKKLARECPDCIPMPDPIFNWLLPLTLRLMHPPVIATSWNSLSEEFAKTCHKSGAIVIMDEGESSPEQWQQAIARGVDGIQTDDPQKLIEFLDSR